MGVTKYSDEYLDQLATKLESYPECNPDKLFLVMNFVVENNLYRQLLDNFAIRNERVACALKKVRSIEELRLAETMVDSPGKVTPVIFALKNVAGWRDKSPDEAKDSATRINVTNINADKAAEMEPDSLAGALGGMLQGQKSGNKTRRKSKSN